ncbi:DUF6894 family protein [uncultured Enterovirga sp.]|uniref:DUF6894 family protein n=1 Tax=uncultured Enterovirga sp. TaxID=2026352 RepID=UPI0035C96517
MRGIDRKGTELTELDEAREEARRRAYVLLTAGYGKGEDRSGWTIAIREESGVVVLRFTLREAML